MTKDEVLKTLEDLISKTNTIRHAANRGIAREVAAGLRNLSNRLNGVIGTDLPWDKQPDPPKPAAAPRPQRGTK